MKVANITEAAITQGLKLGFHTAEASAGFSVSAAALTAL
jgi:hypothetical protein